ncbi:hypothetical protein C8F04DRAFT_1298121 [Mycena alexandri]|uniref:AMP-dependent synthetase/ligase domain-containing protein n=1 Tax=Mycena alexandri TaxID=1745969 RepID=A0AAD6SG74_9AGAR|nr:hypothetical protein C8F04DRAFT_1298121 [Mycena alexandri]
MAPTRRLAIAADKLVTQPFAGIGTLQEQVEEIARGLVELGLTTDNVFNIYAATSVNWQLLARACGSIATTIAAAYDTLGPAGLTHSDCAARFTNTELLPTLLALPEARSNIPVLSLNALRKRGQATKDARHRPQRSRGAAARALNRSCIVYTSRSTSRTRTSSRPAAPCTRCSGTTYRTADLACLPLAHLLELCMLFDGMPTGVGRIKPRTDARTIRKGIAGKVQAGGAIRSRVFEGAVEAKKRGTPGLARLADSLRIAMSGGAAISRETQEFLSVVLVMLLQGYAIPESCAMCAIMPPAVFHFDIVGLPVPSIEIKLRDVSEAGSFSCGPQGSTQERGESRVLDARVATKVAVLALRECNVVGKKSGFKATETLTAVVLTPDEWTPERGLVTAAQKIQKEAYKNQ